MSTKPKIATGGDADFPRKRTGINQSDRRPGGPIAFVTAALVLVFVGYLLFSTNWNTSSVFPAATRALPAPDTGAQVSPAPTTPPAPPPATAPVTQ